MMTTNKFFANVASKALALAAVVMMSVAFTACSSDDEPKPEQTPNSVTINGKTIPVVRAEYTMSETSQDFTLRLHLPERGECVELAGNADQHIGKDINLAKKEPAGRDGYWRVNYFADTHGMF